MSDWTSRQRWISKTHLVLGDQIKNYLISEENRQPRLEVWRSVMYPQSIKLMHDPRVISLTQPQTARSKVKVWLFSFSPHTTLVHSCWISEASGFSLAELTPHACQQILGALVWPVLLSKMFNSKSPTSLREPASRHHPFVAPSSNAWDRYRTHTDWAYLSINQCGSWSYQTQET